MKTLYALILLWSTGISCFSSSPSPKLLFPNAPTLNPLYSPLDTRNQVALSDRLTFVFDQYYKSNFEQSRDFSSNFQIYYLRQELQALVDMYCATNNIKYLHQGRKLVFQAIDNANSNKQKLLYHGTNRGKWPCFTLQSVIKQTGGHAQLNDFQGAAGFMMVASTLKQAGLDGWQEIGNFVEKNIIEKWLFYNPTVKPESYLDSQSLYYLAAALNGARDKREHFACTCLDLHDLGYNKYPYEQWAKFLIKVYLTEKSGLKSPFPDSQYRKVVPNDWGLVRHEHGSLIWHWTLKKVFIVPQDTSHANRTVWLATKAYDQQLIPKRTIEGILATFKNNIWDTSKGPFYFNNYIDGNDKPVQKLGPGRKGNIWFGWHRLALYDNDLKDLFISIGYALSNGGTEFPYLSQNVQMKNAPLCLIAWATRLAKDNTQFP